MSNVFGKRRRLGGPTESPCVECADTTIRIRSHAVATSLAVLANDIFHAERHCPAFETERVADYLSNVLA